MWLGWFNGCVYAQECSLMCFDKITNITIVETGDDGGGDVKQCFTDPIVIYPPDTHPPRPLNETSDQTGPQLLHCLNPILAGRGHWMAPPGKVGFCSL